MRVKLYIWAAPEPGLTYPEWNGLRTEVMASNADQAAQIFEQEGWRGMCSLEDENRTQTVHRLGKRFGTERGYWE
jgi:hypothetical protein